MIVNLILLSMNKEGLEVQLLQEKIDHLQKTLPDIYRAHLLWRGCSPMPCGMVRPHIVTHGNNVYVGGGNTGKMEFTRTVMKYDIATDIWTSLPITAYYTFSMILIKGLVTIIGGHSIVTACVCDVLTSYEDGSKKWSVKFPPMLTKRSASSAVSTSSHVVVAGGISDDDVYVSVVEVLDISSMEWSVVCPLPQPVTFMSIAACNLTGQIYLLGGLKADGAMQSVYSCSLSELITSDQTRKVWKVITDSPYFRSGAAVINGKLIIASGQNQSGKITTTVHSFDPAAEKWSVLGEMPSAKSSCSIAVLQGGQILIIGGYVKPSNWMGSLTKDAMATVNLNVPL